MVEEGETYLKNWIVIHHDKRDESNYCNAFWDLFSHVSAKAQDLLQLKTKGKITFT